MGREVTVFAFGGHTVRAGRGMFTVRPFGGDFGVGGPKITALRFRTERHLVEVGDDKDE